MTDGKYEHIKQFIEIKNKKINKNYNETTISKFS